MVLFKGVVLYTDLSLCVFTGADTSSSLVGMNSRSSKERFFSFHSIGTLLLVPPSSSSGPCRRCVSEICRNPLALIRFGCGSLPSDFQRLPSAVYVGQTVVHGVDCWRVACVDATQRNQCEWLYIVLVSSDIAA